MDILNYVNYCDFDTWTSYIEIYIQSRREELHLIFCPIAENYWFTISRGGQEIAYMVRFAPNMMKMASRMGHLTILPWGSRTNTRVLV